MSIAKEEKNPKQWKAFKKGQSRVPHSSLKTHLPGGEGGEVQVGSSMGEGTAGLFLPRKNTQEIVVTSYTSWNLIF